MDLINRQFRHTSTAHASQIVATSDGVGGWLSLSRLPSIPMVLVGDVKRAVLSPLLLFSLARLSFFSERLHAMKTRPTSLSTSFTSAYISVSQEPHTVRKFYASNCCIKVVLIFSILRLQSAYTLPEKCIRWSLHSYFFCNRRCDQGLLLDCTCLYKESIATSIARRCKVDLHNGHCAINLRCNLLLRLYSLSEL